MVREWPTGGSGTGTLFGLKCHPFDILTLGGALQYARHMRSHSSLVMRRLKHLCLMRSSLAEAASAGWLPPVTRRRRDARCLPGVASARLKARKPPWRRCPSLRELPSPSLRWAEPSQKCDPSLAWRRARVGRGDLLFMVGFTDGLRVCIYGLRIGEEKWRMGLVVSTTRKLAIHKQIFSGTSKSACSTKFILWCIRHQCII
jgi:hypothetical protein